LALELVHDGDARRVANRLEDIGEELVELERLIDDVVTMARLDLARESARDGLPPLRRETVEARMVLQASEARFRSHHPERKLSCRIADELPSLHIDPVLVRRALDNVIDNAAKFSEPDTVVQLEATSNGSKIEIAVQDYGMGISDEDRARVFEPFYRTDRSRARATGGVGLGLALARRIIEAHDGTLEFEPSPGRGSRFVVTLQGQTRDV
jgi:signal transduction histidine kinase